MKYCAFCGNSLQEEMLFCPKCGKKSVVEPVSEASLEKAPLEKKKPRAKESKKALWGAVIIAVIAIAIIAALVFRGDFSTKPTAIEKATESVVLITCYDYFGEVRATGSGFLLYDDSTIVTNYHVIDRALDIKVSTDSDHTFPVESILAFDAEKDIAILKTTEPTGLKCLSIGSSDDMKKGEAVVAIGSPLGNKNTVSAGVFSGRWYNAANGLDELQFSAPISSGSSGGALFNGRGQVIGITTASFINGQNLNLAVPIEAVLSVYKEKGDSLTPKECFKEVYKSSSTYYLNQNNNLVEFSDLLSTPPKYDDCIVTIRAYIVPVSDARNGDYFVAFASEDSAFYETEELLPCIPVTASLHIDSEYLGYAELCGEFNYLGINDMFLSIKYFELFG